MALIRWAILGAGTAAHDFVLALRTLGNENSIICAVGGRNKQKVDAFATEHNIPLALGTVEELIAYENVDIIYIATPTVCHNAHCRLAVRAMRNVLCEAPLGLTGFETSTLIAEARNHKVFLAEVMQFAYYPILQRIRQIINAAEIGEPMIVKYDIGYNNDDLPDAETRDQLDPYVSFAYAPIALMFARTIFKGEDPLGVSTSGVVDAKGCEHSRMAVLSFARNRYAYLFATDAANITNSALIVGTKGTLLIPESAWSPTTLQLPCGKVEEIPLPAANEKLFYPSSAGMPYQIEAIADYIRKGLPESPLVSLNDSAWIARMNELMTAQVGAKC